LIYNDAIDNPGWLLVAQKTIWGTMAKDEKHLPLVELLYTYRDQESTDPRDRVYGLLGLATDHSIQIDYDISVEDLHSQVLQAIIKNPGAWRSRSFVPTQHALRQMLGLDHLMKSLPVVRSPAERNRGFDSVSFS
jgi:hypothetical protein